MIKTTFLATALFGAACAFAQTATQPDTQTVWQYGLPGHQMVITNTTPWFTRLFVGASASKKAKATKNIVDLSPGETASTASQKRLSWKQAIPFTHPSFVSYDRSSNIDVPIVALFYADAAHTQYLGVSTSVVNLAGGGASSVSSLIFKPENISLADDVDRGNLSASNATPNATVKPMNINFNIGEGVGIEEFVWNSATPASIMVNGVGQGLLHKGEIYYLAGRSPAAVIFAAQGTDGRLHVWNRSFDNQIYYGVQAQMFVLGTQDLH